MLVRLIAWIFRLALLISGVCMAWFGASSGDNILLLAGLAAAGVGILAVALKDGDALRLVLWPPLLWTRMFGAPDYRRGSIRERLEERRGNAGQDGPEADGMD